MSKLNDQAIFRPTSGPDTFPEIQVAGVAVVVYVKAGVLRVSVHCDADAPDLSILRNDGESVALKITVNGWEVYAA